MTESGHQGLGRRAFGACSRSHSAVAEAGGGDLTFREKPIAAHESALRGRCRRLRDTCESETPLEWMRKWLLAGSSLSGSAPRVSDDGRGSRT